MKADGLVGLGVGLLAVVVVFSIARDEQPAPASQQQSQQPGAPSVGLVIGVAVFGFVGRRWVKQKLERRPPVPRSWNRRRRALPPAPDTTARPPEP